MNYLKIAEILNLGIEDDIVAAEILNELIESMEETMELIQIRIENAPVIVFGAGPSLEGDIKNMIKWGLHKKCVLVAADGAAEALLWREIVPYAVVTDLDGDINSLLRTNLLGSIAVVHAHGDNIGLLREHVPQLKRILGTTQVCPIGRLHNFGGFTDGDRAVFLAANFNPKVIGLCGMDFGTEIGKYSGSKDKEMKIKKLHIGKILLEELASKRRIINLTEKSVLEIERISAEEFAGLL